MKVKEIMTQNIESCTLEDNLKKVAAIMQRKDSDVVPVVNGENVLIGIVTQKNICDAVAAFDKRNSSIKLAEIKLDEAVTGEADEKIEKALKKMSKNKVKRLIITSQDGSPIGIISLSILFGLSGKKKKLQKKTFSVLKSIYKVRPLVLREIDFLAAED